MSNRRRIGCNASSVRSAIASSRAQVR